MAKKFTCIICPRGCSLTIDDKFNVTGNTCIRGEQYAKSEMTNPMRSLTSTVRVTNRKDTVVSVKTSDSIPKNLIFRVMLEIDKATTKAPTHIGDVIIKNVLDLGVDVVVTKEIE